MIWRLRSNVIVDSLVTTQYVQYKTLRVYQLQHTVRILLWVKNVVSLHAYQDSLEQIS